MAKALRKLTTFEKYGLPAVVIIIGLVIYVYMVYDPLVKNRRNLIGKTNQLISTIGGYHSQLQGYKKMEASVRKERVALGALRNELSDRKAIIAQPSERPGIRYEIDSTAERYGLTISDFEVTESQAGRVSESASPYEKLFADMSSSRMVVQGRYHNIRRFLDEIALIRGRVVLIDHVEMEVANPRGEIRAVLELRI
jgi:hypothetical protein